jgi:hypothetical protein
LVTYRGVIRRGRAGKVGGAFRAIRIILDTKAAVALGLSSHLSMRRLARLRLFL